VRRCRENADDKVRVELRKLLHCSRAMIDDLQEERAAGLRHAGERPDDIVVD